ncbi:MAG: caspase family protein [Pseudomonadota bacterium]
MSHCSRLVWLIFDVRGTLVPGLKPVNWLTCSAAFLIFSSFVIGAAQAKTVALLIGVSDYDETIGLADLRGPANDVVLMRDVLTQRGVSDIRLLADGVEGAERPTRNAIMSGLAALAAEAEDGDFFIVHMSGHGTRQPDANGDEADGYDEVFLPADVTRAEPGSQQIPNGIVDEEIGAALAAIRKTGADVWFIMDSCHSGTGLRAGGLKTADRYIDPTALGLPSPDVNAAIQANDTIVADEAATAELPGQLIAFYSAQADELAREVDFGADSAEDAATNNWFGFFTAKLANRILSAGPISYRQLFQGVLSDMNASKLAGAARLQTPHWEGGLIDAVALGGGDTVGIRQYPIDDDFLSAGSVHGIVEGTIVELVSDAAAGEDESVGFAQVEDVTPLTAFVRPVSDDCAPSAETLCPVFGDLPAEAKFARITFVPANSTVTLSAILNGAGDSQDGQTDFLDAAHPLSEALKEAVNTLNESGQGEFTIKPDTYDIEVRLIGDLLWFGAVTLVDGESVGLSLPVKDNSPSGLSEALSRIAYAERFSATFTSIAKSGSLLNINPVEVSAHWQRSDAAKLEEPGKAVDPVRECRRIFRRQAFSPEAELQAGADIKQCDRLRFAARGAVSGSRDINRVHIDSKFCVRAEYTRIEDNRTTVPVGRDMIMCSDCPDGYSAGNERLFVIVSEARPNTQPINLEGTVDNCDAQRATRSARVQSFSDFIKSLGKAPGTRGAMGGFATEKVWVEHLHWNVIPRAAVLRDRPVVQQ